VTDDDDDDDDDEYRNFGRKLIFNRTYNFFAGVFIKLYMNVSKTFGRSTSKICYIAVG
jgi:hypothetical protein